MHTPGSGVPGPTRIPPPGPPSPAGPMPMSMPHPTVTRLHRLPSLSSCLTDGARGRFPGRFRFGLTPPGSPEGSAVTPRRDAESRGEPTAATPGRRHRRSAGPSCAPTATGGSTSPPAGSVAGAWPRPVPPWPGRLRSRTPGPTPPERRPGPDRTGAGGEDATVGCVPPLAERLGYAEDAKLLILNCDDLGFCHAANVGVYQALRDGLATSASLMVPCPWSRGAAAAYRGDDVGVHLTVNAEFDLYRWGPITHAPSLLDGDGGFPRTVEDVWDHADLDEVRRECRAQIERAILWGFDVSHLDAHMGTMQIKSEFFDAYLDLAVEFKLPLRLSGADTESLIGFPFRYPGRRRGCRVPRRLRVRARGRQPPDPARRHPPARAGRDRGLPAPRGGQPRARGHGHRLGSPRRRPPAARPRPRPARRARRRPVSP